MQTFAFRLRPHEELMAGIIAFAKEHHIRAGVILTCVGSLEQVTLRYANTGKATQLIGHFEIVRLLELLLSTVASIYISQFLTAAALLLVGICSAAIKYTQQQRSLWVHWRTLILNVSTILHMVMRSLQFIAEQAPAHKILWCCHRRCLAKTDQFLMRL